MPKTHSSFFKMLSSRTRVEILRLLRLYNNLTVDDLASRIGVSVPTVSRHLQLLRMQDIVVFKQEAQTRYYEVNEAEIISRIAAFLTELSLALPAPVGGPAGTTRTSRVSVNILRGLNRYRYTA